MKLEHFKIRYEARNHNQNRFCMHIKHKESNNLTSIKKEYRFSTEKELFFFYRLFKLLKNSIKRMREDGYYTEQKCEKDLKDFLDKEETFSLKLYKNANILYCLEHEEHIIPMLYPLQMNYYDIEEIYMFYVDENNSTFVLAEK